MTRGPTDPDRRARIVRAAHDLMGRDGLHTLTHRRIAAHAGVPLGSTTYWFRDLDDLLAEAVALAVEEGRRRISGRIGALPADAGPDAVCRVLAEMTVEYVVQHRPRTVLDYELYVAGLRRPALRPRSAEWIDVLRATLRGRFDPLTADALTAAVDGFTLQALLAEPEPTVEGCAALLRRVVVGPGQPLT